MIKPNMLNIPVLVTGARGFVGTRLVEILVEQGAQVNILSRDGLRVKEFEGLGCKIFRGDVTLPETLPPAVAGRQVIFHTAVGYGSLQASCQVNVDGTRHLIESAIKAGVNRIVHISSIAVHGRRSLPEIVHEDQPYVNYGGNPYEVSKAEGEKLALKLGQASGVEVVIIRPPLIYGPRSQAWVLNLFSRVKYEKIALVDAGRGVANLVYVDDLVHGMILAAKSPSAAGQAFFLSGPKPVTWREYLHCFASMLGKPLPPLVPIWRASLEALVTIQIFRFTRRSPRLSKSDIELMSQRSVFDISKAKMLLKYNPVISLEEGMRRSELWLRESGYLSPNGSL